MPALLFILSLPPRFRRPVANETVSLCGLGLDSLRKARRRGAWLNRRKAAPRTCKVIPSRAFCQHQQGTGPEKQGGELDRKKLHQGLLIL